MVIGIFIWAMVSHGAIRESQAPGQAAASDSTVVVTFQADIAPLLKTNCSPCHFEGGQVVDKYPFAEFETVKKLGEKLNTRLKEKKEQALIVDWVKGGVKEK